MIDKNELKERLQQQFGIYFHNDEYETAFTKSIEILDEINIKKDEDIFYVFIHVLLVDVIRRIDHLEKKHYMS